MSDLLQQSGSAGAADSYGAYCTSCIGGKAANSSTPFVLPDYDEDEGGGDGYNPPDGSLAQQYDLSRHLDSDRTTCNDDTRDTVIKTPVKAAITDSASASNASVYQDAPALSSSRAVFAASAGDSQSTGAAKALPSANISETGYITVTSARAETAKTAASESYSTDSKHLAYTLSANGTPIADTNPAMKRTNGTVETFQTGPATGLMGTISLISSGSTSTNSENRDNRDKRDTRQNDDGITANAGALSVIDESGTSTSIGGDAVKMPRMQQISNAILEQMERMSADTNSNVVNLKLDMADGSKLGLRLRWKGNQVKASFDSSSANLRGEIENGWASLALNVSNTGMQLEPPSFDKNSSGNSGYYA